MVNWLSKISGSIKGILIGMILFFVSIGVLYWNEGRIDMSNIADNAVEISATAVNTEANEKLVYTTGTLTAESTVGANHLKEGNYVVIRENQEVFAWTESTKSESSKTTNGENYIDVEENENEESKKTYVYNKEWTSSPKNSSEFHFASEHQNPERNIKSEKFLASNVKVGVYDISIDKADLPGFTEVTLTDENTQINTGTLTEDEDTGEVFYEDFDSIAPTLENSKYIFKGFGTLDNPEVGDIRTSYSVVNAGEEVTIFGKLNGTKINPYIGDKNSKLYRIFSGTRDEALSQMTTEHNTSTWGLRILGFILMWIGLGMLLGPISAVLDFVPLAGSLSRSVIGIATFIIAAILSTIIVLISMILHNIIAIIAIIVAFGVGAYWYMNNKGSSTKTTPIKENK